MLDLYKNIKERRLALKMTQAELAKITGYADKSMIAKIEKGEIDLSESKISKFAKALQTTAGDLMGWDGIELSDAEYGKIMRSAMDDSSLGVRINVYGSVPAGVPLEAIEDIVDWEEIPKQWTLGGKEYFGLRVKGDSMSPEYLDGDTIILLKQDDCESGDDCVVYVNGYDATFKRVIKKRDHIILQPINPKYEPIMHEYGEDGDSVKIAGIVVELRRNKRR